MRHEEEVNKDFKKVKSYYKRELNSLSLPKDDKEKILNSIRKDINDRGYGKNELDNIDIGYKYLKGKMRTPKRAQYFRIQTDRLGRDYDKKYVRPRNSEQILAKKEYIAKNYCQDSYAADKQIAQIVNNQAVDMWNCYAIMSSIM